MTFSNNFRSSDPLANPLNARQRAQCQNAFNSKRKDLPPPIMLGQQQGPQLPQRQMSMKDFLMAEMSRYSSGQMEWRNEDIYRMPTSPKENGMTKKDIEYWKHAEEETKKLEANMSDEQKNMLADLDKMFPQSKLEDCDD